MKKLIGCCMINDIIFYPDFHLVFFNTTFLKLYLQEMARRRVLACSQQAGASLATSATEWDRLSTRGRATSRLQSLKASLAFKKKILWNTLQSGG